MSFDGQVVLETGGSRGIGRAIVELFASCGATVVVHYRADEAAAADTLRTLGEGRHLARRADVADPAQVRALVDSVTEALGGIDVLVNNAGTYEAHPVLTSSYEGWQESWRRTIDTNLIGPAPLIHTSCPTWWRPEGAGS